MDALSYIVAYARPSFVCAWRDLGRVNKLAEICKFLLRCFALRFLKDHSEEAVLITFGSDCTPLLSRTRHSSTWQHLTVKRSGRSGGDWLVQRCFLLAGSGARAAHFTEPRLLQDKTAWAHFTAFRELLPLPRECGHTGLVVHHYVYDRAVSSAMWRHHRQLLEARRLHEEMTMDIGQARLSSLLSWATCSSCVNHDAHNSLKWGVLSFYDSKDTLRSLFICIESLRQSYDELVAHAPGWISRSLRYEAMQTPETWRLLWVMLGFASDWVEQLVDLELRYESGVLKVHPRWQHHPDLPDMVMNVMLHIWQWRRFSDSRWISLGGSCRSLLGSLLVGLKDFVGEVLQQPGVSTFYLKGFNFLDQDASSLCALVAVSSFVSDSVLGELMVDDRLPKIYDQLMEELKTEVSYVHNLPFDVLKCVAGAVGMNPFQLQNEACSSALTQAGFFVHRTRDARKPPWSILAKPPGEALDELWRAPRPCDETLGKLWELLQMEYPRPVLERGLWLMSMAPWSSTPVEQGHAAASGLIKQKTQRVRKANALGEVIACVDRADVETFRDGVQDEAVGCAGEVIGQSEAKSHIRQACPLEGAQRESCIDAGERSPGRAEHARAGDGEAWEVVEE